VNSAFCKNCAYEFVNAFSVYLNPASKVAAENAPTHHVTGLTTPFILPTGKKPEYLNHLWISC
jgi:hypothetical protein